MNDIHIYIQKKYVYVYVYVYVNMYNAHLNFFEKSNKLFNLSGKVWFSWGEVKLRVYVWCFYMFLPVFSQHWVCSCACEGQKWPCVGAIKAELRGIQMRDSV